ncbi:CHAD domain-containing protein [Paraburkholderia phosphatilytica]|uniref:CHAD domain-containing protein n=1 Tax=Paraburkholderia phosphatilytica TaxID=2282883 RepID=UPI000E47223D|nr:CHAD domain-containing protein [Paraburkholderia phosphatilytica]
MIDATAQRFERHGNIESTGLATGMPPPGDIDPEVLHRLRIALRRLRAVWSAYARQLDKGMNTRERALYRYLAVAVGKSRDWDVLITLLSTAGSSGSAADAQQAPPSSSPTDIRAMLRDAVQAARLEPETGFRHATTTRSFGPSAHAHDETDKRGRRSRGTLRAGSARRADYAAFNDMRRAGTKLDYLIDFFRPVLACHERDVARNLKRIQKRFGKLNDVVACEALLRENPALLSDRDAARRALVSLQRERRRRMRAASRLLAKC